MAASNGALTAPDGTVVSVSEFELGGVEGCINQNVDSPRKTGSACGCWNYFAVPALRSVSLAHFHLPVPIIMSMLYTPSGLAGHAQAQVRRRWARLMTAFVASVALPSLLSAQYSGGLPVGTKAPAAALQMLDGTPANMSQFIGKTPVVVEFWATWCPLCKKLEPQFKASHEKHGAAVTFLSVGVPTNQTRERQLAYVKERALGGTFVFDSAGNAMAAYKVPHTSHVLVLDKQGMVVYNGTGTSQDLEAAIAKALTGPAELSLHSPATLPAHKRFDF
ncbi:MAG: TlpA family protein disulfide reductase [Phycisphaerae bacterium]|nr:TlpA family protein disulfide reductase [Gemmatimonadaceae bacterium]